MTLYLDTSALLKRYVDEEESELVVALMDADVSWTTASVTLLEVRRNLARLLSGADLVRARANLLADWDATNVVRLDETLLEIASTLAETTLARSLDAIHLAAATRLGTALQFVTFDKRQAETARSLGYTVVGA